MAGSGNALGDAVARRIALGGNYQETVLWRDVQPLNSALAIGIEGVRQT